MPEDHWDEKISEENSKIWSDLCKDLRRLHELELPRYSLSEDDPVDFILFADASKRAYGYVAYAVQNGNANFVLAKPKVAPLKRKSLPQLELLGAYVALQGLLNLLHVFRHYDLRRIYVAVDAQVVLSWLLSSTVKTKNVFTANRIKDVKKMVVEIKDKYDLDVKFKYVPTSDNPADLLTRGLSFENFKLKLSFWIHGPCWINDRGRHFGK